MSGGAPGWPADARPRIAVFGFDVAEASQIRRIRSLIEAGCAVISLTQRRGNMNVDFAPEWPNIDLGLVGNEGSARRAGAIAAGAARAARHWPLLAGADLILARNFDLAAIALSARRVAALRSGRAAPPLVYECLDIHSLFTREDRIGRAMRWAERRVLDAAAATIISSPAFERCYFRPVQHHDGPFLLVENKLYLGHAPELRAARPQVRPAPAAGAPLRLGLVGSIRCAPSLDLLCAAADRLGSRVQVVFHGNVHAHAVPDFQDRIAARPNMVWRGPYAYPQGLLAAYGDCDLVWAQDLWQSGANSDWLLPNRIYEASWAGCPQIAVATTETGRRVTQDGLGFTIPRADAQDLYDLLTGLGPDRIAAASAALLARPEADFVQSPADLAGLLRLARPRGRADA